MVILAFLEAGGGIAVSPGDAQALADAVRTLYRDRERRRAVGLQGRRYVEEHYSRTRWAARFEELVRGLCAAPS